MRLVAGALLLFLVACGVPPEVAGAPDEPDTTLSSTTPALATTSTVASITTTTTGPEATQRATLEKLGMEPGEPIDQPADFATLPPPHDYVFDEIPYSRARIASRIEVDELIVDGFGDSGVTITYVPGYTIWDYGGGLREVEVEGVDLFSLNQDGTWTTIDQDLELSPFGPFMEWSDVTSGYEGALSVGITVVGYELIADTETAHIRVDGVRDDLWADLWVDGNAVIMRAIVDFDAEEDGPGNRMWLIWDVLTLDPRDIGPLPPSS